MGCAEYSNTRYRLICLRAHGKYACNAMSTLQLQPRYGNTFPVNRRLPITILDCKCNGVRPRMTSFRDPSSGSPGRVESSRKQLFLPTPDRNWSVVACQSTLHLHLLNDEKKMTKSDHASFARILSAEKKQLLHVETESL